MNVRTVSVLLLSGIASPSTLSAQDPISDSKTERFVLEPGKHHLTDVLDRAGNLLGHSYVLPEDAKRAQHKIEVRTNLDRDRAGCPAIVSQIAHHLGFAVVPMNERLGLYELISLRGRRRFEAANRSKMVDREQLRNMSGLSTPVLTSVWTTNLDADHVIQMLRPFLESRSVGLRLSSVGSSRLTILMGPARIASLTADLIEELDAMADDGKARELLRMSTQNAMSIDGLRKRLAIAESLAKTRPVSNKAKLAPGAYLLEDIIAKLARPLRRVYLCRESSSARRADPVEIEKAMELDEAGCEELICRLAFERRFLAVPIDTNRGLFELVFRMGSRTGDIAARPIVLTPAEVMQRPDLKMVALTTVDLKEGNVKKATEILQPLLSPRGSADKLTIGALPNLRTLTLRGLVSDIAIAIRMLEENTSTKIHNSRRPSIAQNTNAISALRRRIEVLESRVGPRVDTSQIPLAPATSTETGLGRRLTIEAGEHDLRELIDRAAKFTGHKYEYGNLPEGKHSVTLVRRLELAPQDCAAVVSQLAHRAAFAMIPKNASTGHFELIYHFGPRKNEIATALLVLAPDAILRQSDLRVRVKAEVGLTQLDPTKTAMGLRPLLLSNSDLQFAAHGQRLEIRGFADQVSTFVQFLAATDPPQRKESTALHAAKSNDQTIIQLTRRLTELEMRLAARQRETDGRRD